MTRDSESFGFRALVPVARIFVPQSPILLVITILILVCLGSPTPSVAESTITCPPGTYDMLDWMTLDSDLRATYHLEGTSNRFTPTWPRARSRYARFSVLLKPVHGSR